MKDDAARWIKSEHIRYALMRYLPDQMTYQIDTNPLLTTCSNE